jgi:CheY-like chemotaxis protein
MDSDKKKIFFVEDNEEIFELYSKPLEELGCTLKNFSNGKAAMEEINSIAETKAIPPKIIILDLLLPDISGLALLHSIRDKSIFDDTLVIVLTNYESATLAVAVNKTPNLIYLTKINTQPAELANIISKHIA